MKIKDLIHEDTRPTRISQVNNLVMKYGVELVKGKGYFYFVPLDPKKALMAKETGVYVYRISDLPFDHWVNLAKDMARTLKKIK
jgi:hypothetical protein